MYSRWRILGGCALFLAGVGYGECRAQVPDLPTDPLRGQAVFEEKNCSSCHAINGHGGKGGPDLGTQLYFGSVLELGSIMWNHAPAMNRRFYQKNIAAPRFTEEGMLELFGFLYYLRYLGAPGDSARGMRLVQAKGCATCHRVAGRGGSVGPDFDRVVQYDSPLYLVAAMWNHSATMHQEIKKSGLRYPRLSGQDIIDIATYIHRESTESKALRLSPGNPYRGRGVIEAKHCKDCHMIDGTGKSIGPNFDTVRLRDGVTGIASLMWNHGPAMMKYMQDLSIQWPRFYKNEMADLIAYLYFLGFEDEPGNAREGREIFSSKGCADCHRKGGRGPDPASLKWINSPIRMVSLMWNHAGEMSDLLLTQNKELPRLSTGEMRNLYAYLRNITEPKYESKP